MKIYGVFSKSTEKLETSTFPKTGSLARVVVLHSSGSMTGVMEKMPCMRWMVECWMDESYEFSWQDMEGLMMVVVVEVVVDHVEGDLAAVVVHVTVVVVPAQDLVVAVRIAMIANARMMTAAANGRANPGLAAAVTVATEANQGAEIVVTRRAANAAENAADREAKAQETKRAIILRL